MEEYSHPRLQVLVDRARERAGSAAPAIGLVYACDALALDAASGIARAGIGRPVLIGLRDKIERAADAAGQDVKAFEIIETGDSPAEAALRATTLARDGNVAALMKGSLHTDELMSAIVNKATGLRTDRRISHAFLFDLPRYHKLLALADCVVNITPDLKTKQHIIANAVELLHRLGIDKPKVAIVTAVETVNPAILATVDAEALVKLSRETNAWPGAVIEGPFGFDNAFSAEAARVKKIQSDVAGDADLMLVPDLNAGNMLYKSFNHVGGGDCAGLVLGARVPVVLTSRSDSVQARVASVALALLAASGGDAAS